MQQYYIKNGFENISRGMLVLSRPQCVNDHGSFSRFHKPLTLDLHTADNTPNIPVNQVSCSRSKKTFFRNGPKTEFWPFMFHTFILKFILQRKNISKNLTKLALWQGYRECNYQKHIWCALHQCIYVNTLQCHLTCQNQLRSKYDFRLFSLDEILI